MFSIEGLPTLTLTFFATCLNQCGYLTESGDRGQVKIPLLTYAYKVKS